MDENEGGKQDTSLKDGDSSGGAGGSTSPVYTEDQLKKAVNDALAKAGRDAKTLAEKDAALKERESTHERWQREQEEAEEEKLRGKPDDLKALQERRKIKAERDEASRLKAEAAAEKASNAERLARADALEVEINVFKAAAAKGLKAEDLMAKCQKLKLTSQEAIEEIAETMAGAKAKGGDTHFDSNRGSGGGGKLTVEKADKMTMEDYAAERQKNDPSLKK